MLVTEVLSDLGYTAIEAPKRAAGVKMLPFRQIDLLDECCRAAGRHEWVPNGGCAASAAARLKYRVGNGHLEPGMQVLTKPFSRWRLPSGSRMLLSKRRVVYIGIA